MSEKKQSELNAEDLKKKKDEAKGQLLKLKFSKATVSDLTEIFNSGIDTDTPDDMGRTPFVKAVAANNIEVAKYLIERHANLNALDLIGRTALMICAEDNFVDMAELILKLGYNINFKSSYTGFSALTHAVLKNQKEMVKWLIDHNAEVDSEDKLGWTPLMHAFLNRYSEIAKILLENGADKLHQEHGFARKGHWITASDLEEQNNLNNQ